MNQVCDISSVGLINEVCEIDPRQDTVSWETSLPESPDMMEGYIIIHHVCRCMSAHQINRYRRLVEKGTHMEYWNEHTSGHKQSLAKNDLDKEIKCTHRVTEQSNMEDHMAGVMKAAEGTHVHRPAVRVASRHRRKEK